MNFFTAFLKELQEKIDEEVSKKQSDINQNIIWIITQNYLKRLELFFVSHEEKRNLFLDNLFDYFKD